MARCGCGGGSCNCSIEAGENVTVDGSGTIANPYVISAGDPDCSVVRPCISAGDGASYNSGTGVVTARLSGDAGNLMEFGADGGLYVETDCPTVRQCFSAGDGAEYDASTGVFSARLSTDAGNNIIFGGDSGLYVPTGAATVSVDCGLTGNGSAGNPLTAAVGTWPYPCNLDAEAGQVYCDSTGVLRGEPRPVAAFQQNQQILNPANLAVPAAQDTEVATHTLNILNPDSCRDAFVMLEAEVDADFDLPSGNSSAALGITTDEMSFVFNKGATAALDVHIQGTKVINQTIPAGGNLNFVLSITMGRGSGGATYNRIQSFLRAFVFVL